MIGLSLLLPFSSVYAKKVTPAAEAQWVEFLLSERNDLIYVDVQSIKKGKNGLIDYQMLVHAEEDSQTLFALINMTQNCNNRTVRIGKSTLYRGAVGTGEVLEQEEGSDSFDALNEQKDDAVILFDKVCRYQK